MYIVNYSIDGQTKQKMVDSIGKARKFARITKQNGYKVNYIENYKTSKKINKIY